MLVIVKIQYFFHWHQLGKKRVRLIRFTTIYYIMFILKLSFDIIAFGLHILKSAMLIRP